MDPPGKHSKEIPQRAAMQLGTRNPAMRDNAL
jgi:hypothetical protein